MIGALAAVPYFYRQLDETVRQHVEATFAKHYQGLQVSVHSAALTDGGIQVRGVSIVDPQVPGPQGELAYLDELLLVGKTDLRTMLQSTPQFTEIITRRPTIRATRRANGTWSTGRLFPLPKFGDQPPAITVEGGTLEFSDPLKATPASLTIRDGHFKVEPYHGPNATAGGRRPLSVTGSCRADSIRRVELAGFFDATGQAWQFNGTVDGLDVTPELFHNLPGDYSSRLTMLESLRGQVNGRFAVRYNAQAAVPYEYRVSGQLSRGRLDDSRLPHPLTELQAGFRVDNQGLAIDGLTANSGPATLALDLQRAGFDEHAPLKLTAKAHQLKLDRKLATILPAGWQDVWEKALPAGEVDIHANIAFDGTNWTPDVAVACHDIAFTYPKFPYRLEHGTGKITLRDNTLRIEDMQAFSDIEPIRLRGEIHQPGPDWYGTVTVDSRNLRVDQKLTRALPPVPREIVESLNARGSIGLFVHYWRQAGAAVHNRISIRLNDCDLRYAKFPYPLHNVRGVVESNDQVWTFQDLQGTNDTGVVHCSGQMRPGPEGNVLLLNFAGQNVPLEEELRDALRPSARLLWDELDPSGAVDLRVAVEHRTGWRDPQIQVTAYPVENAVAIKPRSFPYRLEKLTGKFDYQNGRVQISNLKAEHGPSTRLSGHGFCEVDAAGGWRLRIEDLDCGRLTPDRDLVQALPPRLKKAIAEMHLAGPLTFHGRFDLSSTGKPNEPIHAGWDVNCDLQEVSMTYSLPLEHINGRMRLAGDFDGRSFRTRGELNLDSLTYKDFQFTEIRGPIYCDDTRLLLGAAVPALPSSPSRTVTGRCCGGTVLTDGWVSFGPHSHYNFDAVVVQAQLSRAAQEVLAGQQKLGGELSARVNIHGQGSSSNLLGGGGHVEVRNADVYELPVMVSLLKILSMRVPDTHAFSSSDIDFRLEAGHIYFDRINFNGDAISLRGTGEMGLDKNMQLTFYTVVGRDQWRVPLVSDVLGGASQQLMAIYVDGPINHPAVRKQALPAVTGALQEIQHELQNMGAATAPPPTVAQPQPAAPATRRR